MKTQRCFILIFYSITSYRAYFWTNKTYKFHSYSEDNCTLKHMYSLYRHKDVCTCTISDIITVPVAVYIASTRQFLSVYALVSSSMPLEKHDILTDVTRCTRMQTLRRTSKKKKKVFTTTFFTQTVNLTITIYE